MKTGIGIGISPIFSRSGGASPYNAITTAWILRVSTNGGSVTQPEAVAVNIFTSAIQASEFDRLWVHGLQNEIAAKTSIINPSSTIISNVNSTTFTAGQGFTGNGSTMYLDTNYNPNTQGVKYTMDDASFGVYSRTNSNSPSVEMGCLDGPTNTNYLGLREAGINYTKINTQGAFVINPVADSLALFANVRVDSGNSSPYKRGVTPGPTANLSFGVPNANFFILATNLNGVAAGWSTRQLSLSFIGSGAINQLNFYNAVQTLGTALGWAV